MGIMLRLRTFVRRPQMPRQPIVVDFTTGQAYRADRPEPSLWRELLAAVKRTKHPRIVKSVEGVPEQVLGLPHK